MTVREFNFDGLIGSTHNYAGLSYGNVASATHQHRPSHPREAALQGLQKMQTLAALGCGQAILPPLRRPRPGFLRQLGFVGGTDAQLIQSAHRVAPELVAACYSAASMWTANAATVSPSVDCADHRLHLSPANLASTLHRSLEADETTRILRAIFANENEFTVHDPLPSAVALSDEGAANHTRLCDKHGNAGIEIFVYGSDPLNPLAPKPEKFPARQTRLAAESSARRHQLDPAVTLHWQQNPVAIDAGVFHNDVISVGNQNVLLCHECAFVDQTRRLTELRSLFGSKFDAQLYVIEFSNAELPLADAVRSYLFNSQLVTRPDGNMTLICPIECSEIESARRCTERILQEPNPVDDVRFLNLRQSMNNGGGPACLRLRVVLTESQVGQIHPGVVLTDRLASELEVWIQRHYRETLSPVDLVDPNLLVESWDAIDDLSRILGLRLVE